MWARELEARTKGLMSGFDRHAKAGQYGGGAGGTVRRGAGETVRGGRRDSAGGRRDGTRNARGRLGRAKLENA
jgi:hypothetical protein